MSTVKVQGNASGTGSITLASPNTNSNRTINLPDVDGSFVTADGSGNVGIGTNSPAAKIDVVGSGVAAQIRTNSGTSANDSGVLFNIVSSGTAANRLAGVILDPNGANGVGSDYSYLVQDGSGNFVIYNQGPERMRLDANGNLLVGVTSTNFPGYGNTTTGVVINAGQNNPSCFSISKADFVQTVNQNTIDGSNYDLISFRTGGVNRGTILSNGSTVSFNTSSDYRLKENVQPMTGALKTVALLKPCTYTWKETGLAGQGFIAHELQEVVPDAVSGEKDAVNEDGSIKPQGIDTSFLVATLTAAIQEQQAMIEEMKAEIAALKGATQ